MDPLPQLGNGVTMKIVAQRAGVTQATVSMSLANNPRISRFTRERVCAIARRLGYRPNPYVAMLMRVRRRSGPLAHRPVLAVVCAGRTEDGWRNHPDPTVREMRLGAFEQAARRGYCAQEFWLHRDGMPSRRFSDILYARGIRGVLLGPLSDAERPPALDWKHFAAVNLGAPPLAPMLTSVCHDHYRSAQQILRACRERGYARPGLVLPAAHPRQGPQRWLAGFLAAASSMEELALAKPLWREPADDASVERWLEREHPDVILSPEGEALREGLGRRGWRIPRDVGLIALNGSGADDELSGIWQNGGLMGALAIDTLIGMIERHECGLPAQATTLMVEGRWSEGATLRWLRPASAA